MKRMIKPLLAALLCLLLLGALAACSKKQKYQYDIIAENREEGDYLYHVYRDGTAEIR